jgi:hypothetical protein
MNRVRSQRLSGSGFFSPDASQTADASYPPENMKIPLSHQIATLAIAAVLGSLTVQAASPVPEPLSLQDTLKLKGGKTLVFQPFVIKPGQSLRVTHLYFGDSTLKPTQSRAVQFIVFRQTPNQDGSHTVLQNAIEVFERGTKVASVLPEYLHPGGANSEGIIAVLIGLLLPAVQEGDARPVPLPSNDSFSAELLDANSLVGLIPPSPRVRGAAVR